MPRKKGGKEAGGRRESIPRLVAGIAGRALAAGDDLILTVETDPGTEKKLLRIFTGRFVSPCMLRKLEGKAAAQADEGSTAITRHLP